MRSHTVSDSAAWPCKNTRAAKTNTFHPEAMPGNHTSVQICDRKGKPNRAQPISKRGPLSGPDNPMLQSLRIRYFPGVAAK